MFVLAAVFTARFDLAAGIFRGIGLAGFVLKCAIVAAVLAGAILSVAALIMLMTEDCPGHARGHRRAVALGLALLVTLLCRVAHICTLSQYRAFAHRCRAQLSCQRCVPLPTPDTLERIVQCQR